VIEVIAAFSMVVVLGVFLKRWKILKQDDGPYFARLLTKVILPAVIFSQLSVHRVNSEQLLLVLSMFIAGCVSLALAWMAGRIINAPRPTIGALMITSAFGSSSLLGYPLVKYVFPDSPQAMTDVVLLSELGVGLPIFTICPLVAMHFGTSKMSMGAIWRTFLDYLRSPIFISVVLGVGASFLGIPVEHPSIAPFYQALGMINGALVFFASLILGLQLKVKSVRGILPLFLISVVVQIVLQPFMAIGCANIFNLGLEQKQVLVFICLMPSAVLGPVFATQYDSDGETAATLAFANIVSSAVLIPLMFTVLV
jgi:hypothetical protein